ncbi:transformer-SR ribonucleoprotein, variant [Coccidioides immitis RS]|uniref:Transformer-SR ribonucleoprotein, variant n=1 Tax=Coccidioides immitis (strain RS) TaxID=246410 RepID=A0A0D8JV39_COCIM|nr:transformer-SR ribonucleoprotein, variant [Coccidioides immitis RS]KJF61024.1 transformer-SR ribonucleoprotein, variant [Coccidioides immitis RS]
MEYENEGGRYDDATRYDRDRSASPRGNGHAPTRNRSMSPNGRGDARAPPPDARMKDDDASAANTGTNLFVTGIHPRLTEADVSRLFEKYGDVQNCSIMLDPHTKESRGFGFVNMATSDQAEAAKEGLQGESIEGRTLSIEKARRNRPRTPTPGKYFGPPKRDFRGPPRGGRFERYDDRRGGYGYGRRHDDGYRHGRYDSYNERSREYGRRDYRDDYGYRGVDRYATSGREERYGPRGEDRRRGGYYDRDDARAQAASAYASAPPQRESREPYGSRSYDNRWNDRYGAR